MPKVIKSDLTTVNTFAKQILENEESEATELIAKITDLENMPVSAKFSPEIWSKLQIRLDFFKEMTEIRKNISTNLITIINSTCQNMESYMEEYDELDDSKTEEIKSSYQRINNEIVSMQETINQYNNLSEEKQKESNTNIYELNSSIAGRQDQLDLLKKHLSLLENLAPTDNSLYGEFSEVEALLAKYELNINSIQGINIPTNTTQI